MADLSGDGLECHLPIPIPIPIHQQKLHCQKLRHRMQFPSRIPETLRLLRSCGVSEAEKLSVVGEQMADTSPAQSFPASIPRSKFDRG